MPFQLNSSSQGSALPRGRGPPQGHKATKNRSKLRHSHRRGYVTNTHQVPEGHDPSSVWLRPLWAAGHGAAHGLQGRVGPQVHQKKGRDTYPHQEEERSWATSWPSSGERQPRRTEPFPSVHNKPFQGKKKKKRPFLFTYSWFKFLSIEQVVYLLPLEYIMVVTTEGW